LALFLFFGLPTLILEASALGASQFSDSGYHRLAVALLASAIQIYQQGTISPLPLTKKTLSVGGVLGEEPGTKQLVEEWDIPPSVARVGLNMQPPADGTSR